MFLAKHRNQNDRTAAPGQVIDLQTRQTISTPPASPTDATSGQPTPSKPDMATEVQRRLHEHELMYLEHVRFGETEAAGFRAESARLLAEWLVRNGHTPRSMLNHNTLGPTA